MSLFNIEQLLDLTNYTTDVRAERTAIKIMKNKEELEKKTGVKKFDICLMNPPYDRGLHLKFLEKVIECTDTVISIQPCEFIARTHLKPTYKNQKEKYKDTIGKHLKNLEVLEDMPFDAGIDTNLGIYVLDDAGGFDYENFYKEFFLSNKEEQQFYQNQ